MHLYERMTNLECCSDLELHGRIRHVPSNRLSVKHAGNSQATRMCACAVRCQATPMQAGGGAAAPQLQPARAPLATNAARPQGACAPQSAPVQPFHPPHSVPPLMAARTENAAPNGQGQAAAAPPLQPQPQWQPGAAFAPRPLAPQPVLNGGAPPQPHNVPPAAFRAAPSCIRTSQR